MPNGRSRAKTVTLRELKRLQARDPVRPEDLRHARPQRRSDCESGPRPCPFIGCRYHLAIDVRKVGVRFGFGEDFLGHMRETCALDVAAKGPHSSLEVADMLGVSRQRVSQMELDALAKLKAYFANTTPRLMGEMLRAFARVPEPDEDDEVELDAYEQEAFNAFELLGR